MGDDYQQTDTCANVVTTGLGDRYKVTTNEEEEYAVAVDEVAGVNGRGDNLQGYGRRIRGEIAGSTHAMETKGAMGDKG
jgi:hypothetical protein